MKVHYHTHLYELWMSTDKLAIRWFTGICRPQVLFQEMFILNFPILMGKGFLKRRIMKLQRKPMKQIHTRHLCVAIHSNNIVGVAENQPKQKCMLFVFVLLLYYFFQSSRLDTSYLHTKLSFYYIS